MGSARVDVSQRTQVQLFGPAFFGVQSAEEQQEIRPKLFRLLLGYRPTSAYFCKYGRGFLLRTERARAVVQSVCRKPSALRVKVLMPLIQRAQKNAERRNINITNGFQLSTPWNKPI